MTDTNPRRAALREALTPAGERQAMRTILRIEADLNDRRGLHLASLPADIRREIRQTWKRIVAEEMVNMGGGNPKEPITMTYDAYRANPGHVLEQARQGHTVVVLNPDGEVRFVAVGGDE